MKPALEGNKSRLDEVENRFIKLEGEVEKPPPKTEQKNEKKIQKKQI